MNPLSAMEALELTTLLLALVALIQSFEFLALRKSYGDQGIWRWSDLGPELASNSVVRKLFALFLNARAFIGLNIIRISIAVGILIVADWRLVFGLLLMHILTLIRFRGTFNGGSDYMNLLVLGAATVGIAFPESFSVQLAAMGYISFQLIVSYFKAGVLKLKNHTWRDGRALQEFLKSPVYEQTRSVKWLSGKPGVIAVAAWSIMLFEILFPLALIGPKWALWFMGVGVFFHLGNVFIFGLNRFLWAWAAAYPALYFCSLYISLLRG